jgi:predicted GNAT family N-acyltransferase
MSARLPNRIVDQLDEPHVHDLVALYQNEWWSKGRTAEDVRKMLAHSDIVFGLVEAESDRLVGFARVLTDRIYRATLYDVIVSGDRRGAELGKRLMDAVTSHPDLAAIEQLELHCLPELEPFYAKWGFVHNTTGTSTLRRRRARA